MNNREENLKTKISWLRQDQRIVKPGAKPSEFRYVRGVRTAYYHEKDTMSVLIDKEELGKDLSNKVIAILVRRTKDIEPDKFVYEVGICPLLGSMIYFNFKDTENERMDMFYTKMLRDIIAQAKVVIPVGTDSIQNLFRFIRIGSCIRPATIEILQPLCCFYKITQDIYEKFPVEEAYRENYEYLLARALHIFHTLEIKKVCIDWIDEDSRLTSKSEFYRSWTLSDEESDDYNGYRGSYDDSDMSYDDDDFGDSSHYSWDDMVSEHMDACGFRDREAAEEDLNDYYATMEENNQ